jgi:hypothetical protein
MNTFAYNEHDDSFDDQELAHEPIPGRPRRRLINKWSVTLLTLLFAAGGFLGGIKIEKGQQAGTRSLGAAAAARGGTGAAAAG